MPSTVSTLVVSWNNRDFLGRCLESLPKGTEIIVVDNASTDGSAAFVAETFPDVKLIRLEQNAGFAAGVNRAAAQASGDYLLLLDADAEATPRAVERLVEFLDEHVTCGAAAGRLLSMTEEWQRSLNVMRLPSYASLAADLLLLSYVWPDNPVTRKATAADVDDSTARAVEHLASICLMVRRRAFDQVQGLDEAFFPVWFEDVDLCKRLLDSGWTVFFVPRASFRHLGGSSLKRLSVADRKRVFYRNLERYMSKHHGLVGRLVTRMLLVTGLGLRVTGSALRGDGDSMRVFGTVMRGAVRGWKE